MAVPVGVNVVAVTAPLKVTAVAASVMVIVVAPTVPEKLAVPTSVMVSVPTPDTDEPPILAPATCPVFKVRLKVAPVTAPMVMVPAAVVAWALMVVAAPKVTAPNVMAVLEDCIVPYNVLPELAVAVRPPVNVSVPPAAPRVSVPVLANVTAFVMVPEAASKLTL